MLLQIANGDTTQIIIVPHPMHHPFNASNLDQHRRVKHLHCAWNIKRLWQNIWKIRRRSFCMELNESAVLKSWLLSAYVANICHFRFGLKVCFKFLLLIYFFAFYFFLLFQRNAPSRMITENTIVYKNASSTHQYKIKIDTTFCNVR